MIDYRQSLIVLLFCPLYAALLIADRFQILHKLDAITWAERPLQSCNFLRYRIQHALLLAKPGQPRFRVGVTGVAKHPLEYRARIILSEQRRARALPRNAIGVRTG